MKMSRNNGKTGQRPIRRTIIALVIAVLANIGFGYLIRLICGISANIHSASKRNEAMSRIWKEADNG
jgi:hypothetical protein